jgi:hypothetical protein
VLGQLVAGAELVLGQSPLHPRKRRRDRDRLRRARQCSGSGGSRSRGLARDELRQRLRPERRRRGAGQRLAPAFQQGQGGGRCSSCWTAGVVIGIIIVVVVVVFELEREAQIGIVFVVVDVVQVQVAAERDAVVAGVHSGPVVAVHLVVLVDGRGDGVAHDHRVEQWTATRSSLHGGRSEGEGRGRRAEPKREVAMVSSRGCCLRCPTRTPLFGKVKFGFSTVCQ